MQQFGSNIGTMVMGGGLNAAFNYAINKPFPQCAYIDPCISGYANWVGKNWSADGANFTTPSSLAAPQLKITVSKFAAYAPIFRSFLHFTPAPGIGDFSPLDFSQSDFNTVGPVVTLVSSLTLLPTNWQFQGSDNSQVWITLVSGATAGVSGEVIPPTPVPGTGYHYHRLVFNGDGIGVISIAQLLIWASARTVG